MDPRYQSNGQVGAPGANQSLAASNGQPTTSSQQAAAADIIRGQLEHIYSGGSGEDTPHTTPVDQPHQSVQPDANASQSKSIEILTPAPPLTATQPHALRTAPTSVQVPPRQEAAPLTPEPRHESAYHRTMETDLPPQNNDQQAQWEQYHSAWQRYYQLYYQRYYLASVYKQRQAEQQAAEQVATAKDAPPINEQPKGLTQSQAMAELRGSIRQKVLEGAQKVRKSRHFTPVVAGLVVLIIFGFLQYNRIIFGAIAAYASPGNIDPQNIIVDPSVEVNVGPEPKMIIPKINVDAPVVYGVGPDHASQMQAMKSGIAHFSIPGANAVPGQVGNAAFAAHSSNDAFASGDYKFVFAQNEKLVKGDIIYMHYEGKRYTYSITSTEVVMPNEVSKIQLQTNKPMLTLISCVPLGTAQKRLLVFAEQINPSPNSATAAADSSSAPQATDIPGSPSPTLLERLFGAR